MGVSGCGRRWLANHLCLPGRLGGNAGTPPLSTYARRPRRHANTFPPERPKTVALPGTGTQSVPICIRPKHPDPRALTGH
jgi:hypothetical protein